MERRKKKHSEAAKLGWRRRKLRDNAKKRITKRVAKKIIPHVSYAYDARDTYRDLKTIYRYRKK